MLPKICKQEGLGKLGIKFEYCSSREEIRRSQSIRPIEFDAQLEASREEIGDCSQRGPSPAVLQKQESI